MKSRNATQGDIPSIVQLLADEELGQIREDFRTPLPATYYHAFATINKDLNQELVVVENKW